MNSNELKHRKHELCMESDTDLKTAAEGLAQSKVGETAWLELDDKQGNVYSGTVVTVNNSLIIIEGNFPPITAKLEDIEGAITDEEADGLLFLMRAGWEVS